MTTIDDGGPAFPMPFSTDEHSAPCNTSMAYYGMSLRDWFAGQALAGVIVACAKDSLPAGETHEEMFARRAYQNADAMLAERAKAHPRSSMEAAVPEMYEALEAAFCFTEDVVMNDRQIEAFRKMEAALAKARGEQP